MAPTFKHAKVASVRIVTGAALAGGTTVDLSSGIIDVTMTRTADTSDITTYGDGDRFFLAGLRNGTFSLNGIFATTYEDKLGPLVGQSTGIWVKHHPTGVGASLPKFTAQVVITSLDVSAPVGDVSKYTMALQRTGPVTSTKGV